MLAICLSGSLRVRQPLDSARTHVALLATAAVYQELDFPVT
jgi:hypothetical protein